MVRDPLTQWCSKDHRGIIPARHLSCTIPHHLQSRNRGMPGKEATQPLPHIQLAFDFLSIFPPNTQKPREVNPFQCLPINDDRRPSARRAWRVCQDQKWLKVFKWLAYDQASQSSKNPLLGLLFICKFILYWRVSTHKPKTQQNPKEKEKIMFIF